MRLAFLNQMHIKPMLASSSEFEHRAFATIADSMNSLARQGSKQPVNPPGSPSTQENILLEFSDKSKPWQPLLRIIGGVVATGALLYKFKEDISADISNLKTELRKDNADLRTELKKDNADLRTELKKDNTDLKTELKKDIGDLRNEFKKDNADLKTELKKDNTDLRNEFKKEFKELKKEFRALDNKFNSINLSFVKDREKYFKPSFNSKNLSVPTPRADANQVVSLEQILGLEDSALLHKILEKERNHGNE